MICAHNYAVLPSEQYEQIHVYDDKMRLSNTGRLPADWTVAKLLGSHPSTPYNPSIANVFYLAGHIETWGRGIEKIMKACREDGINPPQYDVSLTDITVEFTAPEERLIRTNGRVTQEVTVNEQAIIALLLDNNEYTMIDLAGKLSLSRKTIAGCVKSLKEKGVLERIGSDKKGRWHVI